MTSQRTFPEDGAERGGPTEGGRVEERRGGGKKNRKVEAKRE